MAIWQYDFFLVPTKGIIENHGAIPSVLPGFTASKVERVSLSDDSPNYWGGIVVPPELIASLTSVLPQMGSWHKDALMLGEPDGNKIEIWPDDVVCRIDVRDLDMRTLERVVRFAQELDCRIVIKETGEVLDPDPALLVSSIQASTAARFVRDPEGCLRDLGGRPS